MGANGNINDLELAKFIELAGEYGIRVHILHGDNWNPAVANMAALPPTGNTVGDIRQALDTGIPYRWNGSSWAVWSTAGASWGGISGTLSAQTDLQAALDAKMGAGAYVLVSRDSLLTNQINLGAMTSGILMQSVSAGVATISILTDNSTNWNAAYTHISNTSNPHSVTKAQVGLGNADNTSDVNKPVSTAQAAADTAALNAAKAYADTLVVGLLDDRGNYNASVNTFPASGGSGTAGAILKGDLWTVSVAGTLGGVAVTPGDIVRAMVDTPGQTAGNWTVSETNIGYTAENQANKATTMSGNTASNTIYLSAKAVYDWGTATFATLAGSISQAWAALTIDLGHASDTTLSRSAAGVLAVEGKDVPTVESISTFSVGLKTFLDGKFGLRNVGNTFTGLFTNTITAARTWTLPDKNGTVAMTSDITGTNSGTNTGDETLATLGTKQFAATGKTTPVDADSFNIFDSAASNVMKLLTFTNLKAFLKTYFDTLYTIAASTTVAGIVELATTAEINTGTDSTRAMPVDQFVASNRNVRYFDIYAIEKATDNAVGTNIAGAIECPFTGTITEIGAYVETAGVTGASVWDVNKNGTTIMTTSKLSIDSAEVSTRTAATAPTLTTTTIAAGDLITIDTDSLSTTKPKGLHVRIGIRLS